MLRYGGLDLSLRKLITDGLTTADQFSLLALDDAAGHDQRAFAVCKRSVAVSSVLSVFVHATVCCCSACCRECFRTGSFLQRAQLHCKRCISYGNSVRLSVCLSVCPSVRPSVTRQYCVKTAARSTMQFSPLDSKMCLVL